MNFRLILALWLLLPAVLAGSAAQAQDKGSVNTKPLPPLENPTDPKLGAN